MWHEADQPTQPLQAQVLDVVFRIDCATLPVDHATALSRAICEHAPQIGHSERAGVHAIHVAGSQNGWERPEHHGEHLVLSKRTRLRIRTDLADADALRQQLCGKMLSVEGYPLQILSAQTREITAVPTLFCRFTAYDSLPSGCEESAFIQQVADECRLSGFSPTKVMCGKSRDIAGQAGMVQTRSVLLADIPARESIMLQENGLGDYRTMGCGLMIPHKDTGAVNQPQEV